MIMTAAEFRRRSAHPLLLGRIVAGPGEDGRRVLRVIAFCSGCRESHTFDFEDNSRIDTILITEAPCLALNSPFRGAKIAVGLDPSRATMNSQVLARFAREQKGVSAGVVRRRAGLAGR